MRFRLSPATWTEGARPRPRGRGDERPRRPHGRGFDRRGRLEAQGRVGGGRAGQGVDGGDTENAGQLNAASGGQLPDEPGGYDDETRH